MGKSVVRSLSRHSDRAAPSQLPLRSTRRTGDRTAESGVRRRRELHSRPQQETGARVERIALPAFGPERGHFVCPHREGQGTRLHDDGKRIGRLGRAAADRTCHGYCRHERYDRCANRLDGFLHGIHPIRCVQPNSTWA